MEIGQADIDKIKKYTEGAKGGVDKISEYIKAAKKLEAAGKSLTELQSYATTLKFVSEASAVLQVVSIGLAIIAMFMQEEETVDDKILRGVGEINDRVRDLQQTVELGFDRLSLEGKLNAMVSALLPAIARITQALKAVDAVKDKRSAGGDPTPEIDELLDFRSSELRADFQLIHDVLVGTPLTDSILEILYKQKYGAAGQLCAVNDYLYQHAQAALLAIAAIEIESQARRTKEGTSVADAVVAKLGTLQKGFSPDLAAMAAAGTKYVDACLDSDSTETSVRRFVADSTPEFHLRDGDPQRAANAILKRLSDTWPYLDFAVVTFNELAADRRSFVAVPADRVIESDSAPIKHVITWWGRYGDKSLTRRTGKELVPELPKEAQRQSRPPLASMDDRYGGAPEFASADPAIARDRVSGTMTLSMDLNVYATDHDTTRIGRTYTLWSGDRSLADFVRDAQATLFAQVPGHLVWIGSVDSASADLGVASTANGCFLDFDDLIHLRRDTDAYRALEQAWQGKPDGWMHRTTTIGRGGFFRVVVFWPDVAPASLA